MKIEWDRDWSKASVNELAQATAALSNGVGGFEQMMLEAAAEQLFRLADLEK